MNPKKCPKCGGLVTETWQRVYCRNCGKVLKEKRFDLPSTPLDLAYLISSPPEPSQPQTND